MYENAAVQLLDTRCLQILEEDVSSEYQNCVLCIMDVRGFPKSCFIAQCMFQTQIHSCKHYEYFTLFFSSQIL